MNAARNSNTTDQLLRDLDRALQQSRQTTAMAERSLARQQSSQVEDRPAERMRGLDS